LTVDTNGKYTTSNKIDQNPMNESMYWLPAYTMYQSNGRDGLGLTYSRQAFKTFLYFVKSNTMQS
jgi:hypothetical protein